MRSRSVRLTLLACQHAAAAQHTAGPERICAMCKSPRIAFGLAEKGGPWRAFRLSPPKCLHILLPGRNRRVSQTKERAWGRFAYSARTRGGQVPSVCFDGLNARDTGQAGRQWRRNGVGDWRGASAGRQRPLGGAKAAMLGVPSSEICPQEARAGVSVATMANRASACGRCAQPRLYLGTFPRDTRRLRYAASRAPRRAEPPH